MTFVNILLAAVVIGSSSQSVGTEKNVFQELMNDSWVVGISKEGAGTRDCLKTSCLARGDVLRLTSPRESASQGASAILQTVSVSKGLIFEFESIFDERVNNAFDRGLSQINVIFIDHATSGPDHPVKKLTITPVDTADFSQCMNDLTLLSNGVFQLNEIEQECMSERLIHWRVETLTVANALRISTGSQLFGHPEDGQGTGKGEN